MCEQFESSAQVAKAVNKQLHGLMWFSVNGSQQKPAGFHLYAKLFPEFAFEADLRGFAGFQLAARKFPVSRQMSTG